MSYQLWMAPAGGILIGLAAVLLLLLNGRIAGISGILWGALSEGKKALSELPPSLWRWAFLAGMIAGGALAHGVFAVPLPAPSALSWHYALLGGLLVGAGTRLGNGCTSGHGVCGIGLHSKRSLAATLMFMSTGVASVYLLRHAVGGA